MNKTSSSKKTSASAGKSRSSSKKTSSKRKSSGLFTKKKIKPKVKLDSKGILTLFAIIFSVCAILIFVARGTDFFTRNDSQTLRDAVAQDSAASKPESLPSDKNSSQNKKSKPKTDSAKKTESDHQEKNTQPAVPAPNPVQSINDADLEAERIALNILHDAEADLDRLRNQKKNELEKAPEQKTQAQPKTDSNSASSNSTAQNKPASSALDSFFPDAKGSPRIAIVLDDGGHNTSQLKKYLELKMPLTIAVLPKLPDSKECGAMVRASGKELMLHQPMQAVNRSVNPGPGAITPDMSLSEIEVLLKANMAEVGPVKGLNNHEGSLITEDENRIGVVMDTANKAGVFFMDSRTSAASKVNSVSLSMDIPYYKRDIFLDNVKSRDNVLAEIKKGLEIANRQGNCIMIGHVWSASFLPAILDECYPVLVKKGYKFTTVTNSGALIRP